MKKTMKRGKDQKVKNYDKQQKVEEFETDEDLDSLSIYLKQISKIPLLKAKDEYEMCKQIAEYTKEISNIENQYSNKEIEYAEYMKKIHFAREQREYYKNIMVRSNLRLVVSIAKRYQNKGLSLQDLIDEGNIGLIKAINKFDYKKGYRFSTYGTWWIKQTIYKAVVNTGRIIRIPMHMLNIMQKCYHTEQKYEEKNGKKPTTEQLAELTGIPIKKIKKINQVVQTTGSLDTPLNNDNTTVFGELIEDEIIKKPYEEMYLLCLHEKLEYIFNKLSKREKEILQFRYGLNGKKPLTLEETGVILGITRERVRQIQKRTISKLRDINSSNNNFF